MSKLFDPDIVARTARADGVQGMKGILEAVRETAAANGRPAEAADFDLHATVMVEIAMNLCLLTFAGDSDAACARLDEIYRRISDEQKLGSRRPPTGSPGLRVVKD